MTTYNTVDMHDGDMCVCIWRRVLTNTSICSMVTTAKEHSPCSHTQLSFSFRL